MPAPAHGVPLLLLHEPPDLVFRAERPRWLLPELQNRIDPYKARRWIVAAAIILRSLANQPAPPGSVGKEDRRATAAGSRRGYFPEDAGLDWSPLLVLFTHPPSLTHL